MLYFLNECWIKVLVGWFVLNTLHVTFNNYGTKTQISRSHITHKVARYKNNPRLTDHYYNILQPPFPSNIVPFDWITGPQNNFSKWHWSLTTILFMHTIWPEKHKLICIKLISVVTNIIRLTNINLNLTHQQVTIISISSSQSHCTLKEVLSVSHFWCFE